MKDTKCSLAYRFLKVKSLQECKFKRLTQGIFRLFEEFQGICNARSRILPGHWSYEDKIHKPTCMGSTNIYCMKVYRRSEERT